ncbi:hypothetical protein ACNOYE_19985 [Nannocystaceae bacterium ST9]
MRDQARNLDTPKTPSNANCSRSSIASTSNSITLARARSALLHGRGSPFSVVADALHNRPISLAMQVPDHLRARGGRRRALLGDLADLGHVAVGFEADQHEDPRTVEKHVAAIWLAMDEEAVCALALIERHQHVAGGHFAVAGDSPRRRG